MGELTIKSPDFRKWWADHNVREKTHGVKRYHHPVVGDMTLSYENVAIPGDPDQALCMYTVEPGSPSEAALRLLASWTAPPSARSYRALFRCASSGGRPPTFPLISPTPFRTNPSPSHQSPFHAIYTIRTIHLTTPMPATPAFIAFPSFPPGRQPTMTTSVTAYAAPAPKAPLEKTTVERRALREHDVLIEIAYAGICHSDIHQARDEWGAPSSRWCPATRSPVSSPRSAPA